MNESDWLACSDPFQMLEFLRGSGMASDRQFRLFACACYRRVWHLLTDRRSRHAVEVLERLADGGVPRAEVEHALRGACNAQSEAETHGDDDLPQARQTAAWGVYRAFVTSPPATARESRYYCTRAAGAAAGPVAQAAAERAEEGGQCRLLRDIFGSLPLRPSTVAPSVRTWDGGLALKLAQAAYEERDLPSGHLGPARLAVLADCLEDAGCEDALLLGHLRGGGVHVRGCFAVDLILGRS
jgi:hypothetical protein